GLSDDDTSSDEEITSGKDAAFALMGLYCNRLFPLLEDAVETFIHCQGNSISLSRYPIVEVSSLDTNLGGDSSTYRIDGNAGLLVYDKCHYFENIVVTYTGG